MTGTRTLAIVRPGEPGYAGVRDVYGATGTPAAVVLPATPDEVPEALAWARAQPGPLAVRSGGHGISSLATNDGGVVLDLRRIAAVERLGDRRVRIGAGARWGAVARALDPWGLAISSGDSGDVGVGGLATTGGIGLMCRAHGLTIDRLVRAEVVTADGRVVHAAADEHPDLFWAVRGAGANVGIVTRFDFEAAATARVARATVGYRPSGLAAFLQRWGALVESAPRPVSAFLYVFGGPAPLAQATVVFAGDDRAEATRALGPFLDRPDVVGRNAAIVPYASVPLTTGAPHAGQQRAVTRTGLADHLDAGLATELAALLTSGASDMVQIRSAGGAVNDVPADATAYAHRHQNFSVTAISALGGAAFEAAWVPLRERMDGIYLSFETGHRPEDVSRAFPPATLRRLRALKRQWDPDRVFVQNFDVSAA